MRYDERRALAFRVLGPIEVQRGEGKLDLRGGKQRALLAMLLVHANEAVSTDRLIDGLWGERPPATASKALQVYVSQLRGLLEPGRDRGADGQVLVRRPSGYMLQLDDGQLDLNRFNALRERGQHALTDGRPADAATLLRDALALWHGPALADVADEPFAQIERARLEDLRLAVVEERVDADLQIGRHADLVGELEALVAEHPLRESLRSRLMLALYRSGRQADALETYQRTREKLVQELGIEPGTRLRELHQAILRQDPDLDLVEPGEVPPMPLQRGFVGRAGELAQLTAALEDAFAGHGGVVLLSGEPGIGKSRLGDEFTTLARARGAHCLIGRCWEAGGAPAFWPWVQALRTHVRETEAETLRKQLGNGANVVAQLVPDLQERLVDLTPPPGLEAEGARFRLFDATLGFLRNAAEDRPLVLVLDDLHAADPSSLLLLQFAARELPSMRTLVLAVFRSIDPTPTTELRTMFMGVAREAGTRRISLGGLSEHAVGAYVEATSSAVVPAGFVKALHAKTEGNPLFVGEIVRLVSESPGDGIAIPQTIRDVIERRLGRLSVDCNRVLELASVLGREFAVDTLVRVASVSEEDVLHALDEAQAAGVVAEMPGVGAGFRFGHVLIRDAIYEGLPAARRVALHREAVVALAALYGARTGSHLAELAHHAAAAREFEAAAAYGRSAAEHSLKLLAFEESARLYRDALDALAVAHPDDEAARCDLLLSLGEAEARAGDRAAAKRTFLEAAELAEQLRLRPELARAAAGYGGRIAFARAAEDDRLVPLLEAGLAAVDEDVELRVTLLARLAGALRDEHSRARRDELSREAVELARSKGNASALAHALEGRAGAIIAPDTLEECIQLAEEMCAVAGGIQDWERLIVGHDTCVTLQCMVGNIIEATAHQKAAVQVAERLKQPAHLWLVMGTHAALACAAGDLDEAERVAEEAFAFGERAQPELAIPVYRLQQYMLADLRGELENVEPAIADLVAQYPARPMLSCVLAHVAARLGRDDDARRRLDYFAEDDFSALPFDQEWLFAMSLLAETCALLGDAETASRMHELLVPWSSRNAADPGEGIRGSMARYLGLLAATSERWAEAARHFEEALANNKRMGAMPWLARSQEDFGRMLLTRGSSAERKRGEELLQAASATFDQ